MEVVVALLVISNMAAWRSIYYAHYQRKWFDTYHDVPLPEGMAGYVQEPDFDRLPSLLQLPQYLGKRRRMLRQKILRNAG